MSADSSAGASGSASNVASSSRVAPTPTRPPPTIADQLYCQFVVHEIPIIYGTTRKLKSHKVLRPGRWIKVAEYKPAMMRLGAKPVGNLTYVVDMSSRHLQEWLRTLADKGPYVEEEQCEALWKFERMKPEAPDPSVSQEPERAENGEASGSASLVFEVSEGVEEGAEEEDRSKKQPKVEVTEVDHIDKIAPAA